MGKQEEDEQLSLAGFARLLQEKHLEEVEEAASPKLQTDKGHTGCS